MSTLPFASRFAPFLVASWIGAASVMAVETLTLDQAIQALDRSPQMERARSVAEEASWKRVETTAVFFPQVTLNGTHFFNQKFVLFDVTLPGATNTITFPAIVPTTAYTLGAQWLVFDGLANVNRLQGSRYFEKASQKEYNWAKFEGERQVILLFYRALAAQTLKEVAEQNVKTLTDHLNDVRLLKRTGVSTNYDVLRVEVQTSEAQTELMNAEDNVSISMDRLGEVLGEDLRGRSLAGKLPVLQAEVIKAIQISDESENRRTDLQALQDRVEGLEKMESAASKHWVPRVSLFGQFQEYNDRTNSLTGGDAFRNAYNVGVQASWDIFQGFAGVARDHQAIEQRFQAEKALEASQIKARNDVEFWRRRYLYNCSVYQSRVSDIGKSTESVRLAREGRKVGTRTSTDLLDAELELFRARAGVVNAQVGAVESLISLEIATGQKLHQF